MNKKINVVAILLLVFSLISAAALAAVPPGFTGGQLYGGYVIQDKTNWCWAASAENAIIWEMAPTRNQWDAVRHIKGTLFNPHPNVGGSIYDSRDAAEYISKNNEEYTAMESRKSYSFLCEEIYNSHPVINRYLQSHQYLIYLQLDFTINQEICKGFLLIYFIYYIVAAHICRMSRLRRACCRCLGNGAFRATRIAQGHEG